MRTLVISATAAEAAHLPAGTDLVVTGIGKVHAAVATTRAILERGAEDLRVLNVGTAGSLRDGVSGLFTPGTVLNHDISADLLRTLGHDAQERLEIGDDPTVLATGDLFVTDPQVRSALAAQAHLVDMEGYAVAWACRELGVPVTLVKHVSDDADEASMDWPSLVDASARVLGDWVAEALG